jgi:hypothetical protein
MNALAGSTGESPEDAQQSLSLPVLADRSQVPGMAGISEFVADAAAHAPSIYNTSPWWFSTVDNDLCVRSDAERTVPIADPAGRQLMMSCGAAAFTSRIALRYLGLIPRASVLPEPRVANLITKLTWGEEHKQPSAYERRLFDEIARRRTHRGGFASDRLPPGLMATLTEAAARESAVLRVMTDDDHRAALLAVVAASYRTFALDQARVAEQAKWMPPAMSESGDRGWGARPEVESTTPSSPGIAAVLTTASDERADWIRAGQALQRVLLVAGTHGVSVAIDAQPLEFTQLRDFVGCELLSGDCPQMVLRFGVAPRS